MLINKIPCKKLLRLWVLPWAISVADLRRDAGDPTVGSPIFFNSIHLWGKICPNNRLAPLLLGWRPRLGNPRSATGYCSKHEMLNISVLSVITCEDETFTVSPGSPQTINHVSRHHDNCTWTVNVAMGYRQVSRVTYMSMEHFLNPIHWRIQDFPEEGAPTHGARQPMILSIFPVKMKKFWLPGGACVPCAPTPLDPPLQSAFSLNYFSSNLLNC